MTAAEENTTRTAQKSTSTPRPILSQLAAVRVELARAHGDPRLALFPGVRHAIEQLGGLVDGLGRELQELDWRLVRLEAGQASRDDTQEGRG